MHWISKHFQSLTGYVDIIFSSKSEELLCGLYAYLYCYAKQTNESENPLAYMTCSKDIAQYLLHPGTETYLKLHHPELHQRCELLVRKSADMCTQLGGLYSSNTFDFVSISTEPSVTDVKGMVEQLLSMAPGNYQSKIQHIAYSLIEDSSPEARIRSLMINTNHSDC